jgi:hypothetical protein
MAALLRAELAHTGEPGARAREAARLVADWNRYLAVDVDWLSAPDALEHGRDLEARLAALQGPAARAPDRHRTAAHRTGSVLGMPTVGELSDLIDAFSFQVGVLTAAFNDCADWQAKDPTTYAQWQKDFQSAVTQFGSAWDQAHAVLEGVPQAVWNIWPAGDTWDVVLQTKHLFADLDRRMRAAGVCTSPDYSLTPQPKHSDLDLKAFNFSGDVVQGVQKGLGALQHTASSPVPWLALGAILALFLLSKFGK